MTLKNMFLKDSVSRFLIPITWNLKRTVLSEIRKSCFISTHLVGKYKWQKSWYL